MTDKEKARAYDEAIRKAQDVSHTSEFIKITDLFPQLLESEDEKIRRTLISYFEWVKERDCKSEWNGLKVDDIRAWLEKQKEQKSIQCIEFTNEFENQISHLLASVLNDEYEYNEGFVKHAAQSLLGYAKNKLKSDELDKIERLMKALQATNAQIGELVEENYKLKEQKQEWSEEDEGELQNAIDALEFLGKKGVYKSESGYDAALQAASWLKSIPERINLQPKQEWSENDKKMLWIIQLALTKHPITDKQEKDAFDWLNLLRPSWKPSEEQLDALRASNSYWKGTTNEVPCTNILESLYNDLKKLI